MNDLNPREYFNGEPVNRPAAVPVSEVAVAVGETVSTADAAVNLGPAKAVAAVVATTAVAFLGALGVALQGDNVVTGPEWVTIAIATIVSTGLVGGATFLTPTTVTGKSTD